MQRIHCFQSVRPDTLLARIMAGGVSRNQAKCETVSPGRSLRRLVWLAALLTALLGATQRSQAQSLSSVTVLPTSVIGGASATGTITLTGKAPKGGASV